MNSIVLINRLNNNADINDVRASIYYNTKINKDFKYDGQLISKEKVQNIYRDYNITKSTQINKVALDKIGLKALFNKLQKDYPCTSIYMGKENKFDKYNEIFLVPTNELEELIYQIKNKQRINKYISELNEYEKEKKDDIRKETNKFKTKKQVKTVKRKNRFVNGKKVVVTLSTIMILAGFGLGAKTIINNHNNEVLDNNPVLTQEYVIENQEDTIVSDENVGISINEIAKNAVKSAKDVVDNNYDYQLCISTDDWINDENFNQKYNDCKENYYDSISQIASTYGIDPEVALALACHERGYHSGEVDSGGGLGLFQIQIEGGWNWDGKDVTAYNFDTNSYETYTIHKENIRDLDNNIKVAMMIFQNCLTANDYNVALAVQQYNYGISYMNTIVRQTCNDYGFDRSHFDNPNNLEWLNYREMISGGDSHYLENVFKFIPNKDILKFKTPDGETKSIQFINNNVLENQEENQFIRN